MDDKRLLFIMRKRRNLLWTNKKYSHKREKSAVIEEVAAFFLWYFSNIITYISGHRHAPIWFLSVSVNCRVSSGSSRYTLYVISPEGTVLSQSCGTSSTTYNFTGFNGEDPKGDWRSMRKRPLSCSTRARTPPTSRPTMPDCGSGWLHSARNIPTFATWRNPSPREAWSCAG